jgi:hypothetical protein
MTDSHWIFSPFYIHNFQGHHIKNNTVLQNTVLYNNVLQHRNFWNFWTFLVLDNTFAPFFFQPVLHYK